MSQQTLNLEAEPSSEEQGSRFDAALFQPGPDITYLGVEYRIAGVAWTNQGFMYRLSRDHKDTIVTEVQLKEGAL